jgi:sec-independent protein translocase protein TatC
MSTRQPNEDLFESTRMSFGEHLEELRQVLVKCLIAIAICCVFGFLLANTVVRILNQPLEDAIRKYNLDVASDKLVERDGYIAPELLPWLEKEKFIPRQMRVDPGQLVAALQTVVPDFGERVNVDPYSFKAANFDLERLPALCVQLSTHSKGEVEQNKRAALIWSLLDPEEQQAVGSIAVKLEAGSGDLLTVGEIFNRLSQESLIYDQPEFAAEVTEPKSGWLSFFVQSDKKPLAKMKSKLEETGDSTIARRLNRALLTGTFAEYMPELRMELVPVEMWESVEFEPQSLGVPETFLVWLKAGVLTGFIFAGPFVFYFLWTFVAAGLYPHEQKYVHLFLPISIGLFVGGVLLAFFFVFQPVLGFLFSFNRQMGIAPQMRINDWLSFVMFLPLGFGLAFQLPLVMLFMNRIGLFQIEDYLSKWRIAVMIIFVLAMFLTPADPISMLLLAIPLTFLYFLGIAMCRWMPRNKNPYGEPERSYSTAE